MKAGRLSTVPIRSTPRLSPWTSATASWAPRAAFSVIRAFSRKTSPAAVSLTWRVLRISSGAPSSCSSVRMEADRADWTMLTRWAARVKCISCATATK